jgi:hypothetical protein
MRRMIFFIFLLLLLCLLTSSLSAQSKVSYVKFRFAFHLGNTKTNDFYRLGENESSINNSTIILIGYPSNLSHFYACSYDEEEFEKGMFTGLIFSGETEDLNSIVFSAKSEENDYRIEIKQKVEETNLILVFTNGTCKEIDKKIYTIEKYGLPSQAFSVSPETSGISISMVLRNDKILIKGNESLSVGPNKICIEYSGVTKENKPIIEVRRC